MGCSDPYAAFLNAGGQLYAGPKSDVNAATGAFPYSDTGICSWCPIGPFTSVYRRLQVAVTDVDPLLNPNALYFAEAQYISPDDSAAGNGGNNLAWRRLAIDPDFLWISAAPGSATVMDEPAIFAWQANDAGVSLVQAVVPDDGGPGYDGAIWVGARASELGNGWWRYEYAVQNVTSDRSAGAFVVPLPAAAQLANVGFHDVDYHSGERYDSTDWPHVRDVDSLRWNTTPHSVNVDANALRWGTLYNFRFDADVAPDSNGAVELGLFKRQFGRRKRCCDVRRDVSRRCGDVALCGSRAADKRRAGCK